MRIYYNYYIIDEFQKFMLDRKDNEEVEVLSDDSNENYHEGILKK